MQISYNWLKQFIKINHSAEETAVMLTDLGLEVEGVSNYQNIKGGLKGFVVGKVIACEKHPNADKLKLTKIQLNSHDAPVQIVCGAPNVTLNQTVAVATIGTVIHMANGESFKIKKSKIRGEESFGMLCSEVELNIGTANDGIISLPDDWEVGTPLAEKYEIYEDTIFEIGLTPNRSDAMSHWGVARDLRAAILEKSTDTHNPNSTEVITPSVSKFNVDKRTMKFDIDVENNTDCPRFCGVTLSGLKVKKSPQWLQNKLKAIGITPKNNIVDITNYIMHDLGQPLHAYDAHKISGSKIFIRKAKENETLITLDNEERKLVTEDIVIADEQKSLSLAGVMGGLTSSVTDNTTTIFLESAYFNSVSVRKTSKRHTLSTDASFRFERGIDPDITAYTLKYAAIMIMEVAGGEALSDVVSYYPKKIEEKTVFLSYEKVNKTIGTEVPREKIKSILVSLDFKVTSVSDKGLGLTIPLYRVDVIREIDVIEEILRVFGFNNIPVPEKIKASINSNSAIQDYKIEQIISKQLVALGFHEIMNNSLTTSKYTDNIEEFSSEKSIEILNPLSSELSIMRRTLLFGGLESIAYNINRKQADLKFFEFGKTYNKTAGVYNEQKQLALFATGNFISTQWNSPKNPLDFFHFKGYIKNILSRLGLGYKEKPVSVSYLSEGILIEIENKTIAQLGVVSKSTTKQLEIKQEVFFAEIFWEEIIPLLSNKVKYKELSKFPSVKRDLALMIDESISYAMIYEEIIKLNKEIIKDVQLFDVYQGDQLPKGKKSYAISLKLQADSATLTDEEIDSVISSVQKKLEKQLNAELR